MGHEEWQWEIRELCASIFSEIWGVKEKDLLCSFDGGCFMPNDSKCKEKGKGKFKAAIHNDQPNVMKGFSCVQGIVNFVDCNSNDGGLVLVENSFFFFDKYMKKYPSQGLFWGPSHVETN
jgi:hypothetical protein